MLPYKPPCLPNPYTQVLAAPNVTMFNATAAEDLIVKEDEEGVRCAGQTNRKRGAEAGVEEASKPDASLPSVARHPIYQPPHRNQPSLTCPTTCPPRLTHSLQPRGWRGDQLDPGVPQPRHPELHGG